MKKLSFAKFSVLIKTAQINIIAKFFVLSLEDTDTFQVATRMSCEVPPQMVSPFLNLVAPPCIVWYIQIKALTFHFFWLRRFPLRRRDEDVAFAALAQ